ncbi:sigma-w pathway protein ysdB [Chryseomicrobium sp. FSL W7-1435]|uniref:sigma-w pathway protein ysdB n=1 Tax=Chryseomicrobium sp. FSL W7-1435 TaxID=2921704 RepID=UPI003159E25A
MIFRLVLLVVLGYALYRLIRYLVDPQRKLDDALQSESYYFYDDSKNARKNFLISYQGAKFEGEKYLGTTEDAFDVVSIFVWAHDTTKLQGMTREDFLFLEKEIQMSYPHAVISWKNPIEQLMKGYRESV